MGSWGLLAPGGKKRQKRVKNELKILELSSFELVFNSFLTFLPPPPGREAPGTHFETFFRILFTFRLNCPQCLALKESPRPEAIFVPVLPSLKLSLNCPSNCPLKWFNPLSFAQEDNQNVPQIVPRMPDVVRVIERQDRGHNCPAAIFTPRQTDVSLNPLAVTKIHFT